MSPNRRNDPPRHSGVRKLSTISKASLALAVCLAVHRAWSEPAAARWVIPLQVALTNGTMIFSWPVQTVPTEFQALESGSEEWKVVPESLFHTNKSVVTVTLPLTEKEVLYRLRHAPFAHRLIRRAASVPGLPTPSAMTNRPPRPKASPPSPP